MKRKFLITNDVSLAKDKVVSLLSSLTGDCDEDYLDGVDIEDSLNEILGHLEQALDNLGEDE